jgi:outer membrane protein assembly factor BamE
MRILQPNLLYLLYHSVLVLGISGCSSLPENYLPSFIKPYKFDIHQGNFITQQDVAKLQTGMTKDQVRFILGTPLLHDAFHANRWDYLYRLRRADGQTVQSRYTVIFDNDRLVNYSAENLAENSGDLQSPGQLNKTSSKLILGTEKTTQDIKNQESAVGGTERAPILK